MQRKTSGSRSQSQSPSKKASSAQQAANKRSLGSWIIFAWLFCFVVGFGASRVFPLGVQDAHSAPRTLSGRILFGLAHVVCCCALLFLGFLAVGATRWQQETRDSHASPAAGGAGEATTIHNRVHAQFLSNTTEQLLMFSISLLTATPFLSNAYANVVPVLTAVWMAGRLFFWGGYWYTAANNLPTYPRAVGLGMGLVCTLVAMSIAAVGVCEHYPDFADVMTVPDDNGSILIPRSLSPTGSNALPFFAFSAAAAGLLALAMFPQPAPPVMPIALLGTGGWVYAVLSGVVKLRL